MSNTRTQKSAAGWIPSAPPSAHEIPPVSTRRGWIDAVGLVAVMFGLDAIYAAHDCARLLGIPVPTPPSGWDPVAASAFIATIWIGRLVLSRSKRLYWLAVPELGGITFALACRSETVALVPCLELAHRRGLTFRDTGLGPRWAIGRTSQRQAWLAGLVAIGGMAATGVAMKWTSLTFPSLPIGDPRQVTVHGVALLSTLLASGVVEELVMVAGVATALEAARRPVWAIYVVAGLARVSYHLYYGPEALAVVIFAAINVYLYRRTRRLTPLILAHVAYDAVGVYFPKFGAVAIDFIGALVLLALLAVGGWGILDTAGRGGSNE